MKKGILALAVGVVGGYLIAKHGQEIIEKVKASANNESFEQLLKELEKHKSNLFKKDNITTDDYDDDELDADIENGYVFNSVSDKENSELKSQEGELPEEE